MILKQLESGWVATLDRKVRWAFLASRKMDKIAAGIIGIAFSLVEQEQEPRNGGPWGGENEDLWGAPHQVVEAAMLSDY